MNIMINTLLVLDMDIGHGYYAIRVEKNENGELLYTSFNYIWFNKGLLILERIKKNIDD